MVKLWFDRVVAPLLFAVVASVASLLLVSRCGCATAVSAGPAKEEVRLSEYDHIFKEAGAAWGVDWVLLAAIARSESDFRHDAVSRSGAMGLMQIMPYVAARMGVTREELLDAQRNVALAAELLHNLHKMLRFNEGFSQQERLHFLLAAYNAGYGRVMDARRLTRHYGKNSGVWGEVAEYLKLLSKPEYAEHEVVKNGAFHGSRETIGYVRKTMRYYKRYQSRLKKV